jgi:MFS family permease
MTARSILFVSALGAAFFLITATTFASLGVVLPAMIEEFSWSWTAAGLGFTMLALLTGVFSPIAARSLSALGARRHYAAGGLVISAGFLLLAGAGGVPSYVAATALMGAGFALLGNVPGTYLVGAATPENWRTIVIGAYLGAGGAGGVFGPLMANALIEGGDWRIYWRGAALGCSALALAAAVLAPPTTAAAETAVRAARGNARDEWTAKAAMRTPAFFIIAAALTVAYFCASTVSTWSVTHLQQQGLASGFAVGMLSLYAAANAGARAAGGVLARRVSARSLLIAALLAMLAGMTALALAQSRGLAIAFALFEGVGFGLALFATTALLIEYFGLKNSAALLGAANLAATSAMLGPTLAGAAADRWSGFAPVFLVYAAAALCVGVVVSRMRDPNRRAPQSVAADAENSAAASAKPRPLSHPFRRRHAEQVENKI